MFKAKSSFMRVLAACMALALVASACGGGDSDESTADDVESSAESEASADGDDSQDEDTAAVDDVDEPAESEDEEPEADEVEDADEGAAEVPATTVPDPAETDPADEANTSPDFTGSDPDSEFCVAVRELDESDPFADGNVFDPDFFEMLDDFYAELQPIAPAELEGDITTIRGIFSEVGPILAENDLFSPEVEEALEILDDPALNESGERFDAYLSGVCGLDTSQGGDGSVTAGSEEELDETIVLDGAGQVTGAMEVGTFDVYQLDVSEASTLTITMESGTESDLDPVLRVVDPTGAVVENDDAPGSAGLASFDSQVIIDPTVGGLYSIEARSFFGGGSGEFTLTVEVG